MRGRRKRGRKGVYVIKGRKKREGRRRKWEGEAWRGKEGVGKVRECFGFCVC